MELTFAPAKETKGTFKFEEELSGPLAEPKVGTLYVRKSTLAQLGWTEGDCLVVEIAVQP